MRRTLRTAVLALAATGLASFAQAHQLSPKSTCVNQYADAGRQLDGGTLCWTLNDPVKGGACQ